MKTENFFYLHRKEIQKIVQEQNVPVTVATDIWLAQQPEAVPVSVRREWDEICLSYRIHPMKTLHDLFEE